MRLPPPKRISDVAHEMTLTGYLSLFYSDQQPVLLNMDGTDDLFLAVFSTKVKLDQYLRDYPTAYDKIIQIDDGDEFLGSIPKSIRVIGDPYKHGNMKIRFMELTR